MIDSISSTRGRNVDFERAEMAVPIKVFGQLIGVFDAESAQVDAFDEEAQAAYYQQDCEDLEEVAAHEYLLRSSATT